MNILEFSAEIKEPFAAAADAYKAAGLFSIPCNDKKADRIKWKSIRRLPGNKFLSQLQDKFGADNIGILTGERSGVFIVDVDDADQFDAMEARFGTTPIVTATPSGHRHYWYRWNGERGAKLPGVDLLGEGRFAVCPPSFRREGKHQGKPYQFIRGGLEDVDQLPVIRPDSFPQRAGTITGRPELSTSIEPLKTDDAAPLSRERRNERLFMAVKDMGFTLDAGQLTAYAHGYNVTEFTAHPEGPLDKAEVDKVVASVLGYKADGKLMRSGSGPSIILTEAELDARIAQPRAMALWLKLRMEHEARPGPFALDRRALAPVIGWSPGTVDAARKILEVQGDLSLTGKGQATQLPSGKWKKQPNLYALNRGPNIVPNTTRHPLPSLPACNVVNLLPYLQGDIFGDDMKVSAAILDGWDHGVMPIEVRRAMKTKIRAACLTQDALAAHVGLSRPQLTNGLNARFGFGLEATLKLKAFLEVA